LTHPNIVTLVGPLCATRKEGWEKVYILIRLPGDFGCSSR